MSVFQFCRLLSMDVCEKSYSYSLLFINTLEPKERKETSSSSFSAFPSNISGVHHLG